MKRHGKELKNLTKLGKMLGDLNITLNIEDEMPFLGIRAGKINLQRFFTGIYLSVFIMLIMI